MIYQCRVCGKHTVYVDMPSLAADVKCGNNECPENTGIVEVDVFWNKKKEVELDKTELNALTVLNKSLENTIKQMKEDKEKSKVEHAYELRRLKDEYELNERKAVAALEDKLAKEINKLEKAKDSEMAKFKEEQIRKQQQDFQKMTDDNYSKFRDELAKIHSEGNVMTKNIQEMNKEMIHTVGLVASNARQNMTMLDAPKKRK